MDNDPNDFAQKLREDIEKAFEEIRKEPLQYNSHEKIEVLVLNALMDFHEERSFALRTDFEGMVKLTIEAREKLHMEEQASKYDAAQQPEHRPGPDIKEINAELQILEYIELNKRPLTDWERGRQAELNKAVAEHESDKKDLQELEGKLYSRQLKQRIELEKKQQDEQKALGHSEQLDRQHLKQRTDQTQEFQKERDRYVDDYYAAKRLAREISEAEKQEHKLSR